MMKGEMKTIVEVQYLGDLRCQSTHLKSGETLISDAPIDNNGKGEAFSPTDLLATALAKCVITIMGIKATSMDVDLTGTTAQVEKIMASNPRRVAEVNIMINLPKGGTTQEQRDQLERAGKACPVAKSLSLDLKQTVEFEWKA